MYNNLDNDSYGYKGEMFNYYKKNLDSERGHISCHQ